MFTQCFLPLQVILALAGIELVFFIASHMKMYFGFVARSVDNTLVGAARRQQSQGRSHD